MNRVDLAIRVRDDDGAPEHEFLLVAVDGFAGPGSTLPDPDGALAAVERFGEDVFFPRPGPPKLCTQQYGGPQVAVVTGSIDGRPVNVTFRRTDGCEIARWRAMAPLLGGTPGSRGET
ncbi:MAG: serine protease inhibitor [Pseudarthrobacter sp.]|nr:serine protease inhibitor [Pseudarthrobacter sp.]